MAENHSKSLISLQVPRYSNFCAFFGLTNTPTIFFFLISIVRNVGEMRFYEVIFKHCVLGFRDPDPYYYSIKLAHRLDRILSNPGNPKRIISDTLEYPFGGSAGMRSVFSGKLGIAG